MILAVDAASLHCLDREIAVAESGPTSAKAISFQQIHLDGALDLPMAFDETVRKPLSCDEPVTLATSSHRVPCEASCWTGLFEISRRRTWPFHIHNPERTITGTKTNRVAGA